MSKNTRMEVMTSHGERIRPRITATLKEEFEWAVKTHGRYGNISEAIRSLMLQYIKEVERSVEDD